ncbi:MAG: class I tRNA ligase family protein, partial [Candidatus Peribacteraceae bacterium]|nr:class I tRNA ligase family protein [Candidatus Peribacteraceae bacterium]
PSMLKHAGVKTPDQLLIHGFLTSEGEKMSKSTGNVVMPEDVLEKFGGNPDPIRFYLSHEIPVGNDGDFSWSRFEELYDAKLRNELGNLLNRVLVMIKKEDGQLKIGNENALLGDNTWEKYEASMNSFDFSEGIGHAFVLSGLCNKYIDDKKPWNEDQDTKIALLSVLAEVLRHISLMLLPFTPDTAQRISKQLGVPYADSMLNADFVITEEMREFGGQKDWQSIGEPEILFAPLD